MQRGVLHHVLSGVPAPPPASSFEACTVHTGAGGPGGGACGVDCDCHIEAGRERGSRACGWVPVTPPVLKPARVPPELPRLRLPERLGLRGFRNGGRAVPGMRRSKKSIKGFRNWRLYDEFGVEYPGRPLFRGMSRVYCEPEAREPHEKHAGCGLPFIECECSFQREATAFYRGREVTYECECHPCWFEHCECFYDCVYDPDGLMEIAEDPEDAEEVAVPPETPGNAQNSPE